LFGPCDKMDAMKDGQAAERSPVCKGKVPGQCKDEGVRGHDIGKRTAC
jgi:hypothetical protein